MRNRLPFAVLATALVCLFAMPAQAQRARVFVASYGNDANPCTFTSPCRTFQQAVNVVTTGGEVTAIDSAGFGPINITKAVTITSPDGVEAGIVPNPGGDAIIINTGPAGGDVFLRGLTLEGNNSGADGISMTGASGIGSLGIVHCIIRHFTHDGINLQPTGTLHLSMLDTIAANNGNDGFDLLPSGASDIFGVIEQSIAASNGGDGMNFDALNSTSGSAMLVAILSSVSNANEGNGIRANTNEGAGINRITVRDTATNANNTGFNVFGLAKMIFAHSVATGNLTGITINSGAGGYSFGDNHVFGNILGDLSGTLSTAGFL